LYFCVKNIEGVIIETKLREHLKKQGRANKWLANELKKSENIISMYVNSKANIPIFEAYKICSLLNIEIEDLYYPVHDIINIINLNSQKKD
jgi:hypothetical protein